MIKHIFILLILTTVAYGQWADTTTVIMLQFNEPMGMEGLLDKNNYSVRSEDGKQWEIYRVGIVQSYKDSLGNTVQGDTSRIALVVKRLPYKKQYEIVANNVKDRAGNYINPQHKIVWFFFNGYAPERFPNNSVNFVK